MIAALLAVAITVLPPSFDFGKVLVGRADTDSLTITNDSDSTLTLGEIRVDHADFHAGDRSGEPRPGTRIPPHTSRTLEIAFRPSVLGAASATLVLPSDDPAAPEMFVPLAGIGAVPAITVSPDSFAVAITSGQTEERTLTISNGGDVDLEWSIAFAPVSGARGGDMSGVSILWDRSHGQQTSSGWSTVIGDLTARGATLVESTEPVTTELLAGKRLLWSQDAGQAWTTPQLDALDTWLRAGGGLLIEGDNPGSIPVFNGVLNRLAAGCTYASSAGGVGITTSIFPHPATEGVTSLEVALHQAKLASIVSPATELARDGVDATVAIASRVAAGRIIALADELLQNAVTVSGRDNRLFGARIVEWLAGASFASATPPSGIVEADSSRAVTLSFSADDLPSGIQLMQATVASNDPNRPSIVLPITLTVAGRPDIETIPTTLAFGAVVVGGSETDTLRVMNVGEEPLHVASIGVTGIGFSGNATGPLTLAPAETLKVAVTFAPAATGPAVGTVTIASDDPDEAQTLVALLGSGQTDCAGGCASPSVRPPTFAASQGFRFGMEIVISGNPAPIDAFGFDLEFDPEILSFADSAASTALTQQFIFLDAVELAPGHVRCAGFGPGTSPVPPNSTGALMRVFFEVDCATCIPGDATSLVLSALTDDLAGMNACCGTITFSECRNDGDVNSDGVLTEADALCAVQMVLNGGIVPAECDVTGDCEVIAADVNCDSTLTAGDAVAIYERAAAGDPPYPCFAGGTGIASDAAFAAILSRIRDAAEGGGDRPRLLGATPSPSTSRVVIAYVPGAGRTQLRVHDVTGRVVRTLLDENEAAAAGHSTAVDWDGRDDSGRAAGAGIYFVRLEVGGASDAIKVVLLR